MANRMNKELGFDAAETIREKMSWKRDQIADREEDVAQMVKTYGAKHTYADLAKLVIMRTTRFVRAQLRRGVKPRAF